MKEILFTICIMSYINSGKLSQTDFPDENSLLFPIITHSLDIAPPKFVLSPNYQNQNETIHIEYKSFVKSSTFVNRSSKWILSVFVDQNFVQNYQSNEPIHVMCFVEFSVEQNGNDIGKNANCRVTISAFDNDFTSIANCTLKIGRSPSTCSTYFDFNDANFSNWASISAEMLLSGSDPVTSSVNRPSIVVRNSGIIPAFNWTIVQRDDSFGELAIGLPLKSVKVDSSLKIPISISQLANVSALKILLEYDRCLSFNGIEKLNKSLWEMHTDFVDNQDKETGFIRLTSRNRNRPVEEDLMSSEIWAEILMINFIVTERQSKNDCSIRFGISKMEPITGNAKRYFNKNTFLEQQKPVKIAVDTVNLVMIVFPQPRTTPIPLFQSQNPQKPTEIYSYVLHKSGENYVPQLIKTFSCDYNKLSLGVAHEECRPQKYSNSWVVPVQIEHWRTVVYNVFNFWKPESWRLHISDQELNPITNWYVYRNKRCSIMYQSAVLKVGIRLSTLNSFGMNTYLGSDLADEKPWIDYTKEIKLSQIEIKPKNVATVSRNSVGHIMVTVNSSQTANLILRDSKKRLLADTDVSVFSDHWVSVVKFNAICISDFDIAKIPSHPNGEGEFVNVQVKLKSIKIGEKCNLFLSVVFNDKTQLLFEDIHKKDYRLEINGMDFMNGDLVSFQPSMNVTLFGSPFCDVSRVIMTNAIDLSKYWLKEEQKNNLPKNDTNKTQSLTTPKKTDKSSISVSEQRSSLTIVIYCVIGVFVMALLILLLNCIVGLNVRSNSLGNMQRRLSKTGNLDRKNNRTDYSTPQAANQDHYPPLLPPPGPIVTSNKTPPDWGVSSESGIGLERSSLGSQQDPIALSTFRISIANGSIPPSDSSSYIHQTSPFNDVILESQNSFTTESPPLYDPQSCINRSYWSGFSSPYRIPNHDVATDYRTVHDHTCSPDHRNMSDLV